MKSDKKREALAIFFLAPVRLYLLPFGAILPCLCSFALPSRFFFAIYSNFPAFLMFIFHIERYCVILYIKLIIFNV